MLNIFSVSIAVHLVDKVSGALGVMSRNMMGAQHSVDALNKKMGSIHSKFTAGATMMAGGLALATPLGLAIEEASKLELAIARVKIATRASANEMVGFNEQLTEISHRTGSFSKERVAQLAYGMAAHGMGSMTDVRRMLPLFAYSSDYLKDVKGIDPQDTSDTLIALAHQFGKYKPEEMEPIVRAVMALAPNLPGKNVKGFATMGGYLNIEAFRTLKMDPVALMALQATALQTSGSGGAGARGGLSGASLANALTRVIPGVFGSGLLTGKSNFALRAMGLTDQYGMSTVFNKNGSLQMDLIMKNMESFHRRTESKAGRMALAKELMEIAPQMLGKKQLPEVLSYLSRVAKTGAGAPGEMQEKFIHWGFGITGGRAMLAMSDEVFQEQYRKMTNQVATMPSVESIQKRLLKNFRPASEQLATDTKTLLATLGLKLLPLATQAVRFIDGIVISINGLLEKYPKLTEFLVLITSVASAALIIGGAGLMLQAAFMGLQFLAPAAPYILAAVVAITALTLVIQNWPKITHWVSEVVSKNITTIKFAFAALLTIFPPLSIAVKTFNFLLHHHKEIMQFVSEKWMQLGSIMANTMNSIIGLANQLLSTFHFQLPTINSPTVQNWSDSVLKEHGFNTEPIKPMASKKTSNNQTINYSPTINMQVPHGVNMKDTERMLKEVLDKHVRKISRATTSGGGTFNSYAHQGA